MRVTQSQVLRAQMLDTQRKRADGAEAGLRASSGRRIARPSDDPSGARRALMVKAAINEFTIGREKIDRALSESDRRESALAQMTTALSRAREVGVAMANGTISGPMRTAAAAEIDGIRQTLVNLGNAKFAGRYLFAGALTNTPAFTAAGVYAGDANVVQVSLPTGVSTSVTADGGALLRGTGGAQSVLGAVEGLITALQTNNITSIRTGLGELDASIDHVVDTRAGLGATMTVIERLNVTFENAGVALQEERSAIEEMDLVEAYSEVVRTRQAFEQALLVIAQSRTPSIFQLL